MSDQVLTVRPDTPIVIATAHGMIEIHRAFRDGKSMKSAMGIRIVSPSGVRAHVGMEKAEQRSKWTTHDGGVTRPKHHVYEAVESESGFELKPRRTARLRARASDAPAFPQEIVHRVSA